MLLIKPLPFFKKKRILSRIPATLPKEVRLLVRGPSLPPVPEPQLQCGAPSLAVVVVIGTLRGVGGGGGRGP